MAQTKQSLTLPSCIRVVKDETETNPSRQKGTPDPKQINYYGVNFNLNEQYLQQIQQAITNGSKLAVDATTLLDLRYYILFGENSSLPSGLTFCSYYQTGNDYQLLMRSYIALDGDSIHQIRHDCLEDRQLALAITYAHHWLINQLMDQLRASTRFWLDYLSWSVSLPIAMATVINYWQQLLEEPWKLVLPPLMAWLLQDGFKRLLRLILPRLKRWFWRLLLSGAIFSNPVVRKYVFRIINQLGF